MEFSHQGAVHLQEKSSARRVREKASGGQQYGPNWRLAAEIGELLVSVVEDVALLLKSHGDRVLVRVA